MSRANCSERDQQTGCCNYYDAGAFYCTAIKNCPEGLDDETQELYSEDCDCGEDTCCCDLYTMEQQ